MLGLSVGVLATGGVSVWKYRSIIEDVAIFRWRAENNLAMLLSSEFNRTLPYWIDSKTRIDTTRIAGTTFTYYVTLIDVSAGDDEVPVLVADLEARMRRRLCLLRLVTDARERLQFDRQVAIERFEYAMSDEAGVLLGRFGIPIRQCTSHEPSLLDFGYDSPSDALAALRYDKSAQVEEGVEWIFVTVPARSELWGFTTQAHPAHPSGARVTLIGRDRDKAIGATLCSGPSGTCERFKRDWDERSEARKARLREAPID